MLAFIPPSLQANNNHHYHHHHFISTLEVTAFLNDDVMMMNDSDDFPRYFYQDGNHGLVEPKTTPLFLTETTRSFTDVDTHFTTDDATTDGYKALRLMIEQGEDIQACDMVSFVYVILFLSRIPRLLSSFFVDDSLDSMLFIVLFMMIVSKLQKCF